MYEQEIILGLICGFILIMLYSVWYYYDNIVSHYSSSNRRQNVKSARAGNLMNAAQCYGKSCANVNNNSTFYK